MTDNSTFRGELIYYSWRIPDWMQPGGAERTSNYHAFMRMPFNINFKSELFPLHPLPGHDPSVHGPTYAEIRVERNYYYTASKFQLYPVNVFHLAERHNFPPINHIYITMPGGPVYSALLNRPFHINAIDVGPNQ